MQSPTALLAHLDEQLAFLDSSCWAFDQGAEAECKRLATHVRILVHDTGRSTSLLTHLGVKERLWFHDVAVEQRERYTAMRAAGHVPLLVGGLVAIEMSPTSRYVAKTIAPNPTATARMSRFDDWWREQALFPMSGPPPSRFDLMDWLVHKAGGAHIDDELPPPFVALMSGEAMGIHFPRIEPPPQNSPIPAAMRQIAEELRTSLRDQLELVRATAYEA